MLPREFWRKFAQIEAVVAIKVAPFHRYQTLDVLDGLLDSGRASEIALYTGNDDHIVLDLITQYRGDCDLWEVVVGAVGGVDALRAVLKCWTGFIAIREQPAGGR